MDSVAAMRRVPQRVNNVCVLRTIKRHRLRRRASTPGPTRATAGPRQRVLGSDTRQNGVCTGGGCPDQWHSCGVAYPHVTMCAAQRVHVHRERVPVPWRGDVARPNLDGYRRPAGYQCCGNQLGYPCVPPGAQCPEYRGGEAAWNLPCSPTRGESRRHRESRARSWHVMAAESRVALDSRCRHPVAPIASKQLRPGRRERAVRGAEGSLHRVPDVDGGRPSSVTVAAATLSSAWSGSKRTPGRRRRKRSASGVVSYPDGRVELPVSAPAYRRVRYDDVTWYRPRVHSRAAT